ncbi:hypothetical protein [Nocardiopsis lucentensis]|uniref:hypothetical protein n=1 Tax=Nocardiopsis lucentensis TaxID=53441 RepID=UPI00034D7CA7|nr:hypothetical protein [Nocardiopsis lucentensis]
MAIPAGVETVTVTSGQPLTLPDGTPVRGYLRWRAPALNVVPADDYTFGGEAIAQLDANGNFSIALIPQDATGVDPTGWTYEVTAVFSNAVGWTRFITLTKDQPDVVLSDIVDPTPIDPSFQVGYLSLAGGTLTGPLFLAADPTQALEASTKQYVDAGDAATEASAQSYADAGDATRVAKAGDTMTGSLTFTAGDLALNTAQMQATLTELLVASLDTGVLRGGQLTANLSDPHAVDISPVTAFIVDQYTNPDSPTITRVSEPAKTIVLDAAGLARSVTWYVMDATGAVTMQATKPEAEERRDKVLLGGIVYDPVPDEITVVQTLPTILAQPVNQMYDLMSGLGGFRIEGLDVSPNGTNLELDLSAGRMFTTAFNHYDSGALTKDPHEVSIDARTSFGFRHITRTFTTTPPLVTALDVNNYDPNGTVTAMPNNRFQVFRVWMVGNKSVTTDIIVQYGQQNFTSIENALTSIGTAPYAVDEVVRANLALIGYIAVQQGSTDLSDPSQAQFRRPMKFADA